ncbi:MAG: RluA family pseudouridine synthase [Actinobacteria bacterium]|nr:RluA family pseudouridine synthase [Actinomycetota bacterium]
MRSEIRLKHKVSTEESGKRLDALLAGEEGVSSRSFAQKLIEKGLVTVGGRAADKNYRVREEDLVEYVIPPPRELAVEPEPIPLDVRYEDADLIVLSKPAGMVVHPAYGHYTGTLVNALLAHTKDLSGIGGVLRPGIVHRLDKETSGLMLVAKNDLAHQALSRDLRERKIKRTYLALVHGRFRETEGVVEAPIGRSSRDRQRMAVHAPVAREAVSRYLVVEELGDYSLVEVSLETGRTHQIRVHMAHIHHPVAADPTYGFRKERKELGLTRQFLHAYKLRFIHPRTGREMEFADPLPKDLSGALEELRRRAGRLNNKRYELP